MTTITWNCFQVTGIHKGDEIESINKSFNGKSISRNTTHPQSSNRQATLTGEMLE